jgi:hypothetical protein
MKFLHYCIIIICICFLITTSCRRSKSIVDNIGNVYPQIIYQGYNYDILKLNDSVAVIITGLRNDKTTVPHLINLKNIQLYNDTNIDIKELIR